LQYILQNVMHSQLLSSKLKGLMLFDSVLSKLGETTALCFSVEIVSLLALLNDKNVLVACFAFHLFCRLFNEAFLQKIETDSEFSEFIEFLFKQILILVSKPSPGNLFQSV